jgi:hypothetical protein
VNIASRACNQPGFRFHNDLHLRRGHLRRQENYDRESFPDSAPHYIHLSSRV